MTRLEKQMQFILEVDKLKNIQRQTYITDGSRFENDSEHSWHLALMCMILSEHADEKIDVLKVMSMVLIHDIVEIDAGDTYAYDEAANQTKRDREVAAAERIFQLLPKDQADYMRELWEEFEANETKDAKFALTLDKVQPLLLNNATQGKAWKDHKVSEKQIYKRNNPTADTSKELWEFTKNIIEDNIKRGSITKE